MQPRFDSEAPLQDFGMRRMRRLEQTAKCLDKKPDSVIDARAAFNDRRIRVLRERLVRTQNPVIAMVLWQQLQVAIWAVEATKQRRA
jgi:hypothetical protein